MKKVLFTVFVATILAACNKEKPSAVTESAQTAQTATPPPTAVEKKEMELDVFSFPSEIQGCSCYFAKTKEDFNNQKYIYADDYGNNAQVKISGKTVKFPMKEGDFDPSDFSKTLDNGEYKLEMTGKKINDSDEAMIFEGTITVTDKKGQKYTSPVYGECGC